MKSQVELIKRLKELKPYHISPYNLGDMGEIGSIIDKLESPPPIQEEGKELEVISFAEWIALKNGLWFDDDVLLWNIPDYGDIDEWRKEYGFPDGIIRFTTPELYKVYLTPNQKANHGTIV